MLLLVIIVPSSQNAHLQDDAVLNLFILYLLAEDDGMLHTEIQPILPTCPELIHFSSHILFIII